MSSNLPTKNPTGYLGVNPTYPGQIYFRRVAPLDARDIHNYNPGDTWIDTNANQIWMLSKIVSQIPPLPKIANWVNITGAGAAGISTLTGDVGGPIGPALGNVSLVGAAGSGIVTTGAVNTISISLTGNQSFFWAATAGPQVLTPNRGWIAVNAAGTTFSLPAVSAQGDVVAIQGQGAGGWTINVGAGQQIIFNSIAFTGVGPPGSVSSTDEYDSIYLICSTANLIWIAVNYKGNLAFV
jgi:hypothetical protein